MNNKFCGFNGSFNNKGFTLIELVLVMAMLAMVGMMTVPQFVAAAEESHAQAKWDISVTAKNSHNAIADETGSAPTVIALAEYFPGESGQAVSGGILVKVDGEDYTIPTYANSLCNAPTRDVNERVACVGAIQ